MMLKTISIVLPENMIQEIDELLLINNFISRSDFFRHLVRMWQQQMEQKGSGSGPGAGPDKSIDEAPEELDLEYGIPLHIIKELEEKAKLLS